MEIKKGDDVRITTGKFRGWYGRVHNKEKERGVTYFDVFPHYKNTRKGKFDPDLIGLGDIINIPRKHLKKVI